jgi:RND family efflux transporter MFP subunit
MNLKIIAPGAVIVSALIGAIVIVTSADRLQPSQPDPVAPTVRVLEAEPKSVRMLVSAQGTVTPRTETAVVPEVSGNVVWISPNLVAGGYFNADDPMLRIDDRDYIADVERARATVDRSEAEQEFSAFELQRLEELEDRQLISRSEVEAGMRAARVSDANLQDARVALEQAERDLARTEIAAPFPGIIRDEQTDVGQFIGRGTAVANMYAVDYVEVRLPIADQQLAYLDLPLTQRGELDATTAPSVILSANFAGQNHQWSGKLVRTEAEIDSRSRMIQAVARISADDISGDGPSALPPPVGLFVNAEIEGRSAENVVVIPRSAIRNSSEVLIVDDENRLRFREVELLRVYGEDAYIKAGIAEDELICISPLQAVVDGMRVEPVLQHNKMTEP